MRSEYEARGKKLESEICFTQFRYPERKISQNQEERIFFKKTISHHHQSF